MLAVALALPGAAFAVQPQLVQGGHSQLTQVTAPRTGDPAGTLYIVEQDGHVWKRDPGGRVDVASLKKLAVFMHEKLGWLEKPVSVDEMVDLGHLPR